MEKLEIKSKELFVMSDICIVDGYVVKWERNETELDKNISEIFKSGKEVKEYDSSEILNAAMQSVQNGSVVYIEKDGKVNLFINKDKYEELSATNTLENVCDVEEATISVLSK